VEKLYSDSFPLIEEIVAFVCRKSRFSSADAEDFHQEIHVKLLEDNYRVLREFSGPSLKSFLKVVILRAGQDFRNGLWGKYRDSTEAKRLGNAALQLERLLVRDKLPYEEAREILRTNEKIELSDEEFDLIRVRLPPKFRRQLLPVEHLFTLPSAAPTPEDAARAKSAQAKQAEILAKLEDRMSGLPSQQQLLLKLLFEQGLTIAEVARAQKVPQKPLYGERDRALRWLKDRLEEDGISRRDLEEIFCLLEGVWGVGDPESK
jgi:RNA polymerase sigma factor for flagellar operon FliA